MNDDALECYGVMFLGLSIRPLLKITFEEFLTHPEHYANKSIDLLYGDGLNLFNNMTLSIKLT